MNDGRLCLIYTRFTSGTSDHAAADLAKRISADGGRSWSTDKIIVSRDGGNNVMSVSLLRLADGRIALFYVRKESLEDCRPVMRLSNDECATFSEPTLCINDEVGYNHFEAMREMLTKASTDPNIKVGELGAKVVDGKSTQGFRVENGTSPITVWADRTSKLPVRIEATMAGPPQTQVVMTNYEFNIDLDESLFSLEIPAGYKVSESDIDVKPAKENDF